MSMWGIQYSPIKATSIELHGQLPSTIWNTLQRVFGSGVTTITLDSTHHVALLTLDEASEHQPNIYGELLILLNKHGEILLESY